MATAQQNDDIPSQFSTSMKLHQFPIPSSSQTIWCDVSTDIPRSVVPESLRKTVFNHFNSISHPGIKATRRLITARFVWPSINKDIGLWTKQCLQCQKNKVHRHTTSAPGKFTSPDARFSHVHIDLVGPLPPSQGCTHIFTAVDRFTRWPIAVPISNTSAEAIADVFLQHWISVFGVSSTVTSDRGSQFNSTLFQEFTRILGCQHIMTTAYHPNSNGMVERFHRQLKTSIISTAVNSNWVGHLPVILLGIRSTVKEDLGCSAAELVFVRRCVCLANSSIHRISPTSNPARSCSV